MKHSLSSEVNTITSSTFLFSSFYLVWAWDVITPAVVLHPCFLPDLPVCVLVYVAANHSEQGSQVQHREHSHPDHELD